MFGWVRSSSRDILKTIHRNSKGLMNYYNSSQIHFPANSNQYRVNNEFISNQKLLTLHSIASFDLQLSVAPRPHGEPLREARFPDFQAHLRSTRQHRRRPSPAPSAASTARSLPQDLRSFPGVDAIGHPQSGAASRALDQAASDQQTAKAICGRRCQQEARLPQPPS
jgi:hypothetical protein